jgi:Zn-dependent protease
VRAEPRRPGTGLGYPRGVFGRAWRIATIRGVPVNVDPSWVWIAALVVFTLWSRFQILSPGTTSTVALGYAVLGAVLFFGAVFLHEGAHAVAARMNGIEVHGITLVLFGGFTSARSDSKGPGPAFVIAAVGPATSLLLGAIFWGLSRAAGPDGPLSGMLGYVGLVNLFMAVFNVLPGLPLDGGRMLQSAVWRITGRLERGTEFAGWTGMAIGVLLFGLAILEVSRSDMYGAVWSAIIGLFIFQGAKTSRQQIEVSRRLAAATVAEAMDPPPPAVPADMSLAYALERYLRGHEGEAFPVVDGGRVIGMVSFNSAREIGVRDPLRPVREAIIPLAQVILAHPDERLDEVSARIGPGRAALVLREGELVGSISGSGLYRWAATRRA